MSRPRRLNVETAACSLCYVKTTEKVCTVSDVDVKDDHDCWAPGAAKERDAQSRATSRDFKIPEVQTGSHYSSSTDPRRFDAVLHGPLAVTGRHQNKRAGNSGSPSNASVATKISANLQS